MKKTLLLLVALIAAIMPASAQKEMLTEGVITEIQSWFATGPAWTEEKESTVDFDGKKLTVNIATDKDAQWKAQVKLVTTLTTLDPAKQYDFTCKVTSNKAFGGITLKVMDNVPMFMSNNIEVKEGENALEALNFDGMAAESNGVIVFDFGYAPAGTELVIENISLVEHDPVEVEDVVDWDEASKDNLWAAADVEVASQWFANNSWQQIADAEYSYEDGVWSITTPEGMGASQWQGQFHIGTNLSAKADTPYFFYCVVESDQDFSGVTIKLTENGDDANFFFDGRHNMKAGKQFIYRAEGVQLKKDAASLKLVFDFAGAPAGTNIKVSKIYFSDQIVAKATDFRLTGDYNGWSDQPGTGVVFYTTNDPNVIVAKADEFSTGTWGFKIAKGAGWGCLYGLPTDTYMNLGEETELAFDGKNIYVNGICENLKLLNAVFTITLDEEGAAKTLKIDAAIDDAVEFYLPGTCKGWGFTEETKFKPEGNGVYTLTYDEFYGDFKVAKGAGWNTLFGGAGMNMQVGETYELKLGGDNTGFAPGVVIKDVVITLTVDDADNVSIKFEGTQKEEHSYGLVGQFQGWNTATAAFFEEQEDGLWTVDVTDFPGGKENMFKVSIDKSWTCFLANGGVTELVAGETYVCDRANNDNNFYFGESGMKYNVHFVLNPETAELTATIAGTGISLPVSISADAPIYDLQGRKVQNPTHGLYIQNGRKFIVK